MHRSSSLANMAKQQSYKNKTGGRVGGGGGTLLIGKCVRTNPRLVVDDVWTECRHVPLILEFFGQQHLPVHNNRRNATMIPR
mmetsp:Transcript_33602/g.37743  ORF Transcript_33602/g.37743 Transcript_33602/m.37743 type:complete len:82 (-) Transcript_33602:320-565(-)